MKDLKYLELPCNTGFAVGKSLNVIIKLRRNSHAILRLTPQIHHYFDFGGVRSFKYRDLLEKGRLYLRFS